MLCLYLVYVNNVFLNWFPSAVSISSLCKGVKANVTHNSLSEAPTEAKCGEKAFRDLRSKLRKVVKPEEEKNTSNNSKKLLTTSQNWAFLGIIPIIIITY